MLITSSRCSGYDAAKAAAGELPAGGRTLNRLSRIATIKQLVILILGGLLALTLIAVAGPAVAQPLRDRIIDDASVSDRCLTVRFSFPLQYIRHFPYESGSTLRVHFRVSPAAGRINGDALFEREVMRPPGRHDLHITDVAFEGDVVGRPYLIVNFDRDVRFRVAQGSDFRSFVIAVVEGEGDVPLCLSDK